jgi:hypothetical protein
MIFITLRIMYQASLNNYERLTGGLKIIFQDLFPEHLLYDDRQ